MSNLPVATELPIDSRTGNFSLPWRQWLQTIDRALGDAGTDTAALAAQVAAIATALGSPDGTVANIPDQDTLDVVIYGRNGVTVTGKAGMTPVYVELEQPEDTGVGALLAITRDEYGRVSGSKAATMTGTANRITVTNGDAVAGLPTFDIATTYVGQTSLTTLGTISTGTWNATAIAATKGGTGQTSYAVGDLLYASSTTALSKLAVGTNGYVLTLVSGVPAWAAATGGGGGSGCVVQRKCTIINTEFSTTASIPVDDTIPQISEGAAIASVSITPTSTSNYLLIRAVFPLVSATAAARIIFALFKDANADALNAGSVTISGNLVSGSYVLEYIDTAPTTATQSWSVRYGTGAGSGTINKVGATSLHGAGIPIAYITAEEYVP